MCAESPTLCAHLLTLASFLLILVTLPLSLLYSIRVVQVTLTSRLELETSLPYFGVKLRKK